MEEFHRHECRYFDTCSAPLCPLDPETLSIGAWFADEEICVLNKDLEWIRTQRKIQRKQVPFSAGAFTVSMLETGPKATAALRGVEDHTDSRAVSRWIEARKAVPKRQYSPEERAAIGERLRAARASRMGLESLETVSGG